MFVTVKARRRRGRRLDVPEDLMRGDLHSNGSTMTLQPFDSNRPEEQRRLHGAEVVGISAGVGGLLIRGFEECEGRAVLQEWEVQPMRLLVDAAGYERWEGM